MFDTFKALEQLDTPFDTLNKLLGNTKNNDYIADLYLQLYEDTGKIEYKTTSECVRYCFSKIFITRHDNLKIADINSINACKNKFCQNCLKLLQASRLSKMDKVLEGNKQTHDLYHIVLTLPSCSGNDLMYTIDVIFEAFLKLIRYFAVDKKIKGLDFSQYGYFAAMRSLEITYNEKTKEYHPHLHCLFSLKKGLTFNKTIKNKFSYSYDYNPVKGKKEYVYKRSFCEFELILQKLWRKLIDNIMARDKVILEHKKINYEVEQRFGVKPLTNKEIGELGVAELSYYNGLGFTATKLQADKITIDVLNSMSKEDGYSVIMDLVDDSNYYEVFKYAFKLFDENKNIMQYEQFVVLLKAMFKRRQVQCYGGWYDLQIDDNIDMESVNALYYLVQQYLQEDKEQTICCSTLQDLIELKKQGYSVISKKQIFAYLSAMDTNTLAMARKNIEYIVEDLKRQNELKQIETYTQRYFSVQNRYSAPDFEDKSILQKLKERKKSFAIQCEYDRKMDNEYKQEKDFENKSLAEQQAFLDKIF